MRDGGVGLDLVIVVVFFVMLIPISNTAGVVANCNASRLPNCIDGSEVKVAETV